MFSPAGNHPKRRLLIVALTAAAAIAVYFLLPSSIGGVVIDELQRRMLCIFLVAAVFWATEVMPLFATSLMVVGMEILFLAGEGGLARLLPTVGDWPMKDGAETTLSYKVFLAPFASGIVILFMGGFLLSAAVTKHGIDRIIAGRFIRPFMRSPLMLVFGVLGITAFFSMWMSNTATAAMMLAIIAPIVRQLPSEDKYHRAVILAVPFGANIGGIGTPIGTPPNAVALQFLRDIGIDIGFIDWMLIAIPLVLLLLVLAGFLLYRYFPPERGMKLPELEAPGKIDRMGWLTLVILLATIGLWLTGKWHPIHEGVTALLAAAALTCLGVLDRSDVDSIDWNVLLLMWGGLSLGTAMMQTDAVGLITQMPVESLKGIWLPLVTVLVAVTLSNFMSNTAAANLLVPIALAIVPTAAGRTELAVLVAMGTSIAMAMPVATPPNAIAFATGKIPAASLIRSGGTITLLAMIIMLMGYRIMIPLLLRLSGITE